MKLHAGHIEIAVAKLFGWRENVIVSNTHWGISGFNYEIDLLLLSSSNILTEIEIKVTLSDVKADKNKYHTHNNKYISKLYFAIPKYLLTAAFDYIPEKAGIIIVDELMIATIIRSPIVNRNVLKLDQKRIYQILRLGCMRVWNLKTNHYKYHYMITASEARQLLNSPTTKDKLEIIYNKIKEAAILKKHYVEFDAFIINGVTLETLYQHGYIVDFMDNKAIIKF